MYEDVLALRGENPKLFDRGVAVLDPGAIGELRAAHPWLPAAYTEFLASVGWGSFGGSRFMLYDLPLTPEEAFIKGDATAGMLFVGDDFAGCFIGFKPGSEAVFQYGSKLEQVAPDFGSFMRGKLAELAKKR